MKKKIITFMSMTFILITLVGCGNSSNTSAISDTKELSKQEETKKVEENPNEKTVDGVKFTVVNISREDANGDRTQDNVSAENGEYFAKGKKIVKASDYEYVTVKIKVENTTDKALTLSQYGWSAQMADGYKLKDNVISDELKSQMPSKYSVEGQVKILAEKKLAVKQFQLQYNLIDYTNFSKMLSDAISGKSEAECKKNYPEVFKENYITFNIEVK